jgi:hypothetical protein
VSGTSSRRAFVGGGVALAAGVGIAKLPGLGGGTRRSLALEVDELTGSGSAPAFGTLRPGSGSTPLLSGRVRERGTARIAGRHTVASLPSDDGMLQVHTLDLHDGTIVALGAETGHVFAVASGTRAYAGATGRVTVRGAASAAPSIDVDLEL